MVKAALSTLLANAFLTPLSILAMTSRSSLLYTPTRITFEKLVRGESGEDNKNDDIFWKTLKEVGMISVTNVPEFNKNEMFSELEECVHKKKIGVPEFSLDDGTRRLTIASRTTAGQAEDVFIANPEGKTMDDKCPGLRSRSHQFRNAVKLVSEAFASRLRDYTGNTPVLTGSSGEEYDIEQVITHGDHLEHFHSYYTSAASSSNSIATIDWHIDQGLVLMFTPGQQNGKTTNGFFIQLSDGSSVEVDFDSSIDDLVIMLGDGIDQYLNPILEKNQLGTLRAVPHALTLPETGESGSPRIWYGRMVLPPTQALYPVSLSNGGNSYTFGEMRSAMINEDPEALSVGCASESMVARELHVGNPDKCDPDYTIHCWMRCMEFNNTKYSNVTRESCEEEGLEALCVDDDENLWINGLHDNSYYIQCGDRELLEEATLRPTNPPTISAAPTMTPVPTITAQPTTLEGDSSEDKTTADDESSATATAESNLDSCEDIKRCLEEDGNRLYESGRCLAACGTGENKNCPSNDSDKCGGKQNKKGPCNDGNEGCCSSEGVKSDDGSAVCVCWTSDSVPDIEECEAAEEEGEEEEATTSGARSNTSLNYNQMVMISKVLLVTSFLSVAIF